MYLFNRNALMTRSDYNDDAALTYQDGDVTGSGWGLRLGVSRGPGMAMATFARSDYEYELLYPGGGGHKIRSDRNDFAVNWSQASGNAEGRIWGWTLGYRYIGVRNDITLSERGTAYVDDGDTTWHLVEGGYFGQYDLFEGRYVSVYGAVKALLGEASGLARSGSDAENNGTISETYKDEYSVAYGANITGGITFHLLRNLDLTVDYFREWLYSFSATDTGTVVFPDNDDALFIENQEALNISLDLLF
jgi:hypothetical protein